MTRKRMLAPEFFTSATMNALPMHTMLTFAGIWCFVDDAGRAEDDEKLVRASVWPRRRSMTDKKVRADIDMLGQSGPLCQYVVGDVHLFHVTSWSEHQSISHPTKSKLPPCQIHEPDRWGTFLLSEDPALHKFQNGSGTVPAWLRSDSGATP